ncbi:MAG: ribonuclease R [Proteobacteria bacterium]|nr:MAG: ribonuclease R [Pseudomonadota bacterium]
MRVPAERVLRLLDRADRPVVALHDMTRAIRGAGGPRALQAALRELEREGRIERAAGGWRLARASGLAPATAHVDRDGTLVAIDEVGRRHRLESGAALEGERVLVEPLAGTGAAEVARSIGGARREWVGILSRRGREGRLTPYRDDAKWELRIPRASWRGGRAGDVVVAVAAGGEPRERGARGRRPRAAPLAKVVEVLGPPGTPEADFRAIAWRHRLRRDFPPEVLAEADACDAALEAAETARRLDLRALPFVTIDPATARDHDDAVCVEPLGGGRTRLWVAIADVSHFVAEDGALDREARLRGNSVYFPDRAIPMLPERLSGELCSLRPDVDRLALAVELEIGARGAVRAARFSEAVIRSRARLVYDDAAIVMGGGVHPHVAGGAVTEQLRGLAEVARRLGAARSAAGAIDFDLPSAEIVLGDEGHPTDIIEAPRTVAHRAIEEAMLAANRAVAEQLLAREVPALYRVHEPPTPTALAELRALLESFGLLELPRGAAVAAGDIAEAMQRARGRPEERLVHTTALRSMRPARYDARCLGHFALAFAAYLHFTSPIRRYADLVVHRALRDVLAGDLERARARAERMPAFAERTSSCERNAMEAEREAVDLAKCVFMKPRVGESYEATITRVARHGFYATPDDFFVEGLVPVRTLHGRFELDERGVALVARGTARFTLGDRVQVRVAQVDLVRGWIDFALESEPPRPRRRSRKERT